ncbi:MAG: sigma-70 family RNA polymerase sigma factor, partial [Candidatus Halalkalibacterium sp. M3_1C_030]
MNNKSVNTENLWKEFSGHVRNFIRQRVPDKNDAEDVLQDIFIRIHKGIGSLKNEERVESWVFSIARRALADYYRSKDRKKTTTASNELEESADDVNFNINDFEGEHDVHEEVLSWLIPMIDELPKKYRIPLKMADVEGKTQQEVADRLDLSLSGAKSRVQR